MKTICIAGKNKIAVETLQFFITEFPNNDYCYIPNKNDKGIDDWQPSFSFFAEKNGLRKTHLKELHSIKDLVFISVEFDTLVKPSLFVSKELFNIHFSALPKYKGMYTSALPLLHGAEESGVTLHKIEKGIDTGDIVDQKIFSINKLKNSKELYGCYLKCGFELIKKNAYNILNKNYQLEAQSEKEGSYYSKNAIDYSNLEINYRKTALEIHNQFRAFTFRDYQMIRFEGWQIAGTEITKTKSRLKPKQIVSEDEYGFTIASIDYDILMYKDYYPPFWQAAQTGDLEGIKKNRRFVSDIDLRNKQGWNALILAVYNNHLETAKYLLKEGANPNGTNYKGTSVLMYALSCLKNTGDDKMIKLILSYKPNLHQKDWKGLTISQYYLNKLLKQLYFYRR